LVPAIETAVKAPEVVKTIEKIGAIVDFVPGEQYKKMMAEEYAMVREFMKTSRPPGK